ncbi:hypothetical protein AXG93_1403s1040 [Marchantia polymorpha subsp. ruderalis]|uniref:Uncharacterized protein n=1 Tax=Marchantia polymorpha subsp. ruderalis TaxID=1480154 RepID=A0A176VIB7_MARPO|nr:hypothetical protein AXG93_1403s1040 [Marchantia polymorpha subsp. ruderalis]
MSEAMSEASYPTLRARDARKSARRVFVAFGFIYVEDRSFAIVGWKSLVPNRIFLILSKYFKDQSRAFGNYTPTLTIVRGSKIYRTSNGLTSDEFGMKELQMWGESEFACRIP